MLDSKGFDLWADGYDQAVGCSDEDNTYPFAGYKAVLGHIFRVIAQRPRACVLDMGFGTAVLTSKLYERGYAIYGQDFSPKMIELASGKMPEARLYQGDFANGLAEPLKERRYDFIVATYSLHHLTDEQKVALIRLLREYLRDDGRILIGDVAFETREELNRCRQAAGDEWDDEEVYFVAEELKHPFSDLSFIPLSHCAGVLTIPR